MKIKKQDIKPLALGATLLGSGGGSPTLYQEWIVLHLLEQGKEINILQIEDVKEDDVIFPIAFMGAPLVAKEKIPTGQEAAEIITAIRKQIGEKRRLILMPGEIGGSNALTPLWIGALYDLPILDADSLGRAFPKLQMSSLNLAHIPPSPAFLADSDGKSCSIQASDAFEIEKKAREACIGMGSRALIAFYSFTGKQLHDNQDMVIKGSITKALNMGKDLLSKNTSFSHFLEKWDGQYLGSGSIDKIEHRIEGGFLKGTVFISPDHLKLRFINEFFVVEKNGEIIGKTPDIIALIEKETRQPMSTADLKWGLSVDVVAFPSPSLWKTEKGLQLVGMDQHEF